MNKRKSPIEEYIEELRQLCASLDEDAVNFFHAMEEQGIEMKTDTEEVLKQACPQYVITGLLQSLQENNLTGFLTIFEENKLDMTGISKILFMTDTSRLIHSHDEDVMAMEVYDRFSFMEGLNNIAETSLPKEITQEVIRKRCIWIYSDIVNHDEMSYPNLVLSVNNKNRKSKQKKWRVFSRGRVCESTRSDGQYSYFMEHLRKIYYCTDCKVVTGNKKNYSTELCSILCKVYS